jgi:endo-1,4-beta-xylanase
MMSDWNAMRRSNRFLLSFVIVLLAALRTNAEQPSLFQSASADFAIGAAVTSAQVKDPATSALILHQFNCLTAEYEFMPQFIEPKPGKYTFDRADKVADFAQMHHLPLTGHMLCWGQLTPAWMYADGNGKPLPREQALTNLKQYIDGTVQHFNGKVDSWNVVNEAISDNANEWLRDTPAHKAIGDDYIEKAFEYAHAADPNVPLYYNDYNIEDPQKLPKVLKLIKQLQEQKVRLDAVGIQGHWLLDYPNVSVIDDGIDALTKAGVKVMITELDVDVLPRKAGADLDLAEQSKQHGTTKPTAELITPDLLQREAARYSEIFKVLKKHRDKITRVTFWGVDDSQSWLNDYPIKGRMNAPLLFDRKLQPKLAFDAVINVLKEE